MATQTAKRTKKSEYLHEFKRLQLLKTKKETELDKIKDAIVDIKAKIMGKFEEEGVSSTKLETGETVFIHAQYWAKPVETKSKEDVMQALRLVGLEHLIKEDYNTNSLSAIIREYKKNKEEIPPELAKVILVEPSYDIRIRGLK